MDALQAVKNAITALDQKFGKDIVALDIQNISIIADYFIIASGTNPNQIQALTEEAAKSLTKSGANLRGIEGRETGTWILLDFGDIIVHIFDEEAREFYNLERTWGDATVISNCPEIRFTP